MKAIDCRPEARQAAAASAPPADVHTPADRYQELFIAVQSGGIFDDCKAFVDCAPQDEPASILAAYRVQCGRPGFDLNAFVHQHFAPPCIDRSAYVCTPGVPALVIRAMRLFSTTTFMGPKGGEPVPSMTITLRIVSVGKGPRPSVGRRSGAATRPACLASSTRPAEIAMPTQTSSVRFFTSVFTMSG